MERMSFIRDCTTIYATTTSGTNIIVLLSGSPKPSSIENFSRFMKDKGVTDILCFFDHDYDANVFSKDNINFHDLAFRDGMSPESTLIKKFDQVIDKIMEKTNSFSESKSNGIMSINMQCQSGLGRAPTMLAYLLITRCGYGSGECVKFIRYRRPGVFNTKQLKWVMTTKFKKIKSNSENKTKCIIL
jgi:protein-tyrosine phosphatase